MAEKSHRTRVGRPRADVKIYERPWELAAYRRARVQVFLLPGGALAVHLAHLVAANLSEIGIITSGRKIGTWYLTESGPAEYDVAGDQED